MKFPKKICAVFPLFMISMAAFSQSFPACTNASSDPDGDGWGWENNQSCQVVSQCNWYGSPIPLCTSAATGWGWENNKSCVSRATCATAPNGLPASSTSSSSRPNTSSNSSSGFSSSGNSTSTTLQENVSGFCGVDGSIDSNHVGYTGSGFINTTNAVGMGVNYSVTVDSASYVMLEVQFASINNRPGNILVNGNVVGRLNFVSTGAWTSWTTENLTIPLSAGVNTIRIASTTDGGLPNIDSLNLVGNGIRPAACNANPGDLKNPPVKSLGCGKALSLQDGRKTITSNGRERVYHVRLPRNYDANKPYRLFYVSHGLGGISEDIYGFLDWFGLKPEAEKAGVQAIWIAPSVPNRGDPWGEADHALFDNITNFAKANLCVDTSRVFVTGMSFGGMISYSLSTNHQKVIRAGFGMSPANYNVWLPNPKRTDPIAWMQTTGMSDGTTPWDGGNGRGAKYIALEKARDNGCNVPSNIETWRAGTSSDHLCVDMQGCNANYPVKVCTFNGGHTHDPRDRGASTSWVPAEAWKFFMQF